MKIILTFLSAVILASWLFSACTPTVRVSQSQQTWNEYKGKDVKKVTRKNSWKHKK